MRNKLLIILITGLPLLSVAGLNSVKNDNSAKDQLSDLAKSSNAETLGSYTPDEGETIITGKTSWDSNATQRDSSISIAIENTSSDKCIGNVYLHSDKGSFKKKESFFNYSGYKLVETCLGGNWGWCDHYDNVKDRPLNKRLDCTLNVYFDSKMYLIRC